MGGQGGTGNENRDGAGNAGATAANRDSAGSAVQDSAGSAAGAGGNAIEVRALRKSFGRTVALDGLDLTVRSGEVHAFLRPNGAVKTTTIRILLGLLAKDGGEAVLLG